MITAKTKSFLLLIVTLIIGIIIGFLVKSWIVEHRFEQFNRLRTEGGFLNFIEENIELTVEQKEQLSPVLSDFRESMSRHAEESKSGFHMLMDSLKTDLQVILSLEQYNKLLESHIFQPRGRFRPGKPGSGNSPDSLVNSD